VHIGNRRSSSILVTMLDATGHVLVHKLVNRRVDCGVRLGYEAAKMSCFAAMSVR
jgi:hypothetical protein